MSRHPDVVTVEVLIGAHLLRRLDAAHLGSSSFTLSGLSHQGELNVDVLDHNAATKLVKWFGPGLG